LLSGFEIFFEAATELEAEIIINYGISSAALQQKIINSIPAEEC